MVPAADVFAAGRAGGRLVALDQGTQIFMIFKMGAWQGSSCGLHVCVTGLGQLELLHGDQ